MSRPHILVANVHFAPFTYGGATVVADEVARHLVKRGLQVTALSSCVRPNLAPYTILRSESGGIANYLINLPPHRPYASRYDNPDVTARVIEIVSALAPDMIHAHCLQEIGTGVLEAAQLAGIPSLLSVHDYWWLCERQFMVQIDERACGQDPVRLEGCRGCVENFAAAQLRQRHLARMAEGLWRITYPSAFARDLSEASGFGIGKGVVWPNGVHLPGPDFEQLQRARRARDGRLTFGYLGGPATIKGWPLIRDAFAGMGRDDFRVLLVDGSRDESWWKGASFDDLPGQWKVVPRFDQARLDAFYARIDVLLFPSQWEETFGLAIREGLARGIEVIQTDGGGTTEHAGGKLAQVIPMESGPEPLRAALTVAVARGAVAEEPVPVTSFADQAAALSDMLREVI
ncbi:MAG: glycosyltransferase [Sulfitobacter sp.]|nr:glycosyltransferase [Sulfitobacter sp.]